MWSLIGWSRLLKSSYRGFDTDLASRMAAALASYTVLSLAPLLILIITVAGFVFGRDVVQSQLVGQVTDLIGTEGGIAVAGMIKGASQAKGTGVFASILGLITLLWGATNVVNELRADLRSEEHTSELQSHLNLVCRLLLEKKKKIEPADDQPANEDIALRSDELDLLT